ncbi:hypothetical protein ACFIQG_06695 [Comamonas odontotermitis]|uniref:hypothetical protein n=1 Tax=Comamonas odontotermitis TaxID=379895 RepID=UPI00366E8AC7
MKLLKLKKILAVSLLLNAAYACAAPGDWDLSPWVYSNNTTTNPATITNTTSSIASQGTPSVNLQVTQTASGTLCIPSPTGCTATAGIGGTSNSTFSGTINNLSGPAPATNHEVVEINYSPTLATFGPAAAQGNAFTVGKSGFSLRKAPPSNIGSTSLTITLSGGAVFDAVGGTATSRYQQTAGGVGTNFVTYTWNPLAPAVGTSLFLNGLVINGPVDKITITQDSTSNVQAANTSQPQTTLYATRINPAALLLVSPQPDIATGVMGAPITPINVLGSDTSNGQPATLTNSTLQVGTDANTTAAANAGVVLDPSTGQITSTAATPPGTYVITYTLCDKSLPPACANTTATVTIAGTAAPQPDTVTATAGAPVTPLNVLANDTTDGVPSTLGNSTLTVVTPASNPGVVLDPATGLVTTTAAVPPGTYTITYQLCNKAVPAVCATATVTLTVNDKNASVSTPVPVNSLWAIVLMGLATAAAFVRIRSKV